MACNIRRRYPLDLHHPFSYECHCSPSKNTQEYYRKFKNIQESSRILKKSRIFKNIQEYMACNIRRQYPLDLRQSFSYMNAIVAKARIFNNIQEYPIIFKKTKEYSRIFTNVQEYSRLYGLQ